MEAITGMRSMDIVVGSGFQSINARRVVDARETQDVQRGREQTILGAERLGHKRNLLQPTSPHETFDACLDVLWGPIFPRCCLARALDGFAR